MILLFKHNRNSHDQIRLWHLVNLFVFVIVLHVFQAFPSHAELKAMSPDELKSSTAQAGFTSFTMNNSTARLFLDIHIETYATIDRFASGWNGTSWDQKWNTISLGKSLSEPLVIDGLVFMADFQEGTLDTDPVLERIVVGSNCLQGTISGLFETFSGMYNSALTGENPGNPVVVNGTPLSATSFVFNSRASQTSDMGLYFILNMNGAQAGLQVVAGYDEKSLAPNTWWDSP